MLTLLWPAVSAAAEGGLVFPADGGVLDVRAFGAKPVDDLDDTAAIQRALDQHPSGNRVIYLPPGWWNYHQMIFVRGLDSENAVPAIYNEKDSWGTVALVDSRITGRNAGDKTPGILNERRLYLRNVAVHGYAKSVDNADKGRDKGDIVPAGLIAEETSTTSAGGWTFTSRAKTPGAGNSIPSTTGPCCETTGPSCGSWA